MRWNKSGGKVLRRTPPGVRELKHDCFGEYRFNPCRTPPGVRELKLP